MHHRYGRHGPHAWRRWHKRRYGHFSVISTPVASPHVVLTTVIHAPVAVTTERIIFIIMANAVQFDDWDESKAIEAQSKLSLLQNTDQQENSPIANHAIWKVLDDIGEIQSISREGTFLIINREELRQRSNISARAAIRDILKARPPTMQEHQRLIQEYQEIYHQRFEEELQNTEGIRLYTEQEIRLWNIAIEDRKNAPQHRDYHIRDLAVIRVIADLGVSAIDGQEHLTTIHNLADFYQQQYSNPRKAVHWPIPGPF